MRAALSGFLDLNTPSVTISPAPISTAKRHSARSTSATTPSAEDIAPSASTSTAALATAAPITTAPNPAAATMASSNSNTTRPMSPADVKDMVNEMMKKLAPVLEAITEAKSDLKKAFDAIQEMEKKWLEQDGRLNAVELGQKQFDDEMNRLYQKAVLDRQDGGGYREGSGDIKAVNYKQEVLEEKHEHAHETIMDDIRVIKEKQEAYEKSLAAAMSELHETALSSVQSSNGEKNAYSITCATYVSTSKKGPSTRSK
ncbi:hypothetical protein CSAL01_11948 [Colletotrichum salicis]|uniref:Uncharacterized protein n=1 Tax=Colletotrichum salicis TaxID=1209931 RepID=A0A135V2Y0_9PEZI|nr:hypothetical protein CSAL01_11948 [Colletotrichum salicis]